jgi:protein-tyrosine phosphatase
MRSVIDLHCHVLPGIDDGPPTIEAALEMAREAQRDGITTIAATPHIHPSYPENDAARVWARIALLQPRLDAAGIAVKLVPGGEVDALYALELADDELRALHLGGGPWLLLECPLSAVAAPAFIPTAKALAGRGHQLLLAHPERSPVFLRHPERLDELVNEEGALAQVTAGSLSGQFGRTVRELAHRMVETRSVQVAASDGHGAHRPATIARELEQAGIDQPLAHWLAHDVPKAILAGAQPPAAPDARRSKSARRRLFGR